MSKVIWKALTKLGNEPQELHWLTGFEFRAPNDWYIRPVLRGRQSGVFQSLSVPIGLYPALALGVWFDQGELKWDGATGESGAALIEDLSAGEVITSADIPAGLYEFPSAPGVQRLFRYSTDNGEVMIPVVELVRFLFAHNRALANALMRPGVLNLLFHPEPLGYEKQRTLQFTAEMPERCLTKPFVKEFAWLAFDPDARRSWDSVAEQTWGRNYVMFSPPPIQDSVLQFRGIQRDRTWLVLELLSLSGRRVPCAELFYSHPKFTHVMRLPGDEKKGEWNGQRPRRACDRNDYEYEVEEGEDGSTSDRNLQMMGLDSKYLEFDAPVKVIKLARNVTRPAGGRREDRAPGDRNSSNTKTSSGSASVAGDKRVVKVSVGEHSDIAQAPPLDFRLLVPAKPETMGDLEALAACVRALRKRLPRTAISTALVELKPGRAFSKLGRKHRPALIVVIRSPSTAPVVLLDVERTGVKALSVMALLFLSNTTTDADVELTVKKVLDGLVDSSGHWDKNAEAEVAGFCRIRRLPKYLIPRDKAQADHWAEKLIKELRLN